MEEAKEQKFVIPMVKPKHPTPEEVMEMSPEEVMKLPPNPIVLDKMIKEATKKKFNKRF